MPFSNKNNNSNDSVSLQVHGSKDFVCYTHNKGKRVYLFTSKGSVTLEAAISLMAFLMIAVFVIGFISIIKIQYRMQVEINDVVKNISANQYYISKIGKYISENEKVKQIKDKTKLSNDQIALAKNTAGDAYMLQKLKANIELQEDVPYGISMLNDLGSSLSEDKVDFIVGYNLTLPYFKKSFYITQRGKMKCWTGVDITKEQEIVYIAETGTVYHTTTSCSALIVKISKTTYSIATDGSEGRKYKKCLICGKDDIAGEEGVFVTNNGNKYHTSIGCSGLKRTIIEKNKDEVGDMPACSKCGGEKQDD